MSIITLVKDPRESFIHIDLLFDRTLGVVCICDLRLGCVLGTSSATCGWSAWPPPPQLCTPAALLPATLPAADSS